MVRMRALGLGVGLRHIRAFLGLAVVARPGAVIDVARSIHPHQTRTAARSLRHCRSLRRRRRWLRGRCRNRTRSWSCHLRRCSSWRRHRTWCSHRGRSSCRSSRSSRSRRIPLLYALVPTASSALARGPCISAVVAKTRGVRRLWPRRGRWRSRSFRSCRSSSRSSCSSGSSRCRSIPVLHPLMSVAGPLFAGGRRISPILALTCRTRRRLSHRNLPGVKSNRNRQQTNRCLHRSSEYDFGFRWARNLVLLDVIRPNPTPSGAACHSPSARRPPLTPELTPERVIPCSLRGIAGIRPSGLSFPQRWRQNHAFTSVPVLSGKVQGLQ
jgi:hypothetical protein